jgi:type III secretion protein T
MEKALDLVDFFAQYPHLVNPSARLIPTFFLVMCRLVPVVHMANFLGSKNLPIPVKVGMAVGLFAFVLPTILLQTQDLSFGYNIIFFMFKEFFIGAVLGLMIALPFYVAMIAGSLIDHQRGASSLMVTDPVLSIQDSSLGVLFVYLLCMIYWSLDLPFKYIDSVAQTFEVLPLNHFLPPHMFDTSSNTFASLQEVIGKLFSLGISLAAPSLIILLMTDMFLGIANRLAPQVMISFLAQSLKAVLALLILCLGWKHILDVFASKSIDWHQWVHKFVLLLKY